MQASVGSTRRSWPVGWTFLGASRLTIVPPDSIEASQLELFTGRPILEDSVDEFDRARRAAARAAARAGGDLGGLPPP